MQWTPQNASKWHRNNAYPLLFLPAIPLLACYCSSCLPLLRSAEIQKLTVMTVQLDVQDGGAMDVSYHADAVPVQWVGSDATLIAILVLQVGGEVLHGGKAELQPCAEI